MNFVAKVTERYDLQSTEVNAAPDRMEIAIGLGILLALGGVVAGLIAEPIQAKQRVEELANQSLAARGIRAGVKTFKDGRQQWTFTKDGDTLVMMVKVTKHKDELGVGLTPTGKIAVTWLDLAKSVDTTHMFVNDPESKELIALQGELEEMMSSPAAVKKLMEMAGKFM